MSFVDRVRDGERQASWWCDYCFGNGRYLVIPEGDEVRRREVYSLLETRLAQHRCPRKPRRTWRSHNRVL